MLGEVDLNELHTDGDLRTIPRPGEHDPRRPAYLAVFPPPSNSSPLGLRMTIALWDLEARRTFGCPIAVSEAATSPGSTAERFPAPD